MPEFVGFQTKGILVPYGITFDSVGVFGLAFHLLFKSCSTYCGTWGVAYKKSLEKIYKKQYFHQAAFYCLLLTLQYLKKMHMKTTPKSR